MANVKFKYSKYGIDFIVTDVGSVFAGSVEVISCKGQYHWVVVGEHTTPIVRFALEIFEKWLKTNSRTVKIDV